MPGRYYSKPLVHYLPLRSVTACGLNPQRHRYVDGELPLTTQARGEVTCGSCKRSIAWKSASG